jgi:hypothetical protein
MKPGQYHMYPSNVGVTGKVFTSGKFIYGDHVKGLTGFVPSIDNLSGIQDVVSLMVAPIFANNDDPKSLVGVLQLINKAD